MAQSFDPYVMEVEGFDELLGQIEDLENGHGEMGAIIVDAMMQALSILEQEITTRTPVNFGHLRGSIYTEMNGTPVSLEGKAATNILYGWPVERGRQPGKMPPVDAIELWVVRKGLAKAGTPEAKSAAYLIARAIGRRGTEGAAMFYKGMQAATPRVDQVWGEMMDRIVAQLATGS